MRRVGLLIVLAAVGLSACGEPSLRELRNPSPGPDEFIVAPSLPLQQPENYADLPQPTPGGANITDAMPLADAVVALGGRPSAGTGPVPGSDQGLVNYAGRNGVQPNIRAVLAEEDEAFRKRQSRFANIKLFPVDRYADAYKRQALEADKVAAAFRRAGIATPTAPPTGR